ncbi:MAG TPA: glycosyltransferase family 39 protein [Candidatus Obscuribacterales bacterium]
MNLDASSRQRCRPEPAPGSFDRIDLLCACGLSLVCLVMFFWGLGSYGIIDPGDGYFCEGAREMIELGDYVRPHLNYQVYFSKPILIYWLIASAYHVFGISEFAARFWPAALSTGLALSIYWLGRCAFSRRTGLLAGLVFASSPLVVTFARLSLVDAPLTCFVGLSVIALLMTTVLGSRRWWPVLYIAMGLSMLTKGPVGVVLVAGAFAVFLFVRRPGRRTLIRPLQGEPGQVSFYQEFKPSVMFYLKRPVDTFFSPDQLALAGTGGLEGVPGGPAVTPLYILAGKGGIKPLLAVHRDQLKLIDRKGPWHLFQAEGLTLRKLPTLEEAFRKRMQMTSGKFTWGALPFAGGSARPLISGSEQPQ